MAILKWTPSVGPLGPFLSWKLGRSDLLNPSCYMHLLLLLRLWACGQCASVVQAQRHVHSRVAERAGGAVAPDRHRGAVAERLVRTTAVVKGSSINRSRLALRDPQSLARPDVASKICSRSFSTESARSSRSKSSNGFAEADAETSFATTGAQFSDTVVPAQKSPGKAPYFGKTG
jgi:hypothetical protein